MKQVTQTLRTGVVEVSEVPVPAMNDKYVLVRNTVSVISAGTEKTKIDMGKKNLFQKAKARPDLVKQVMQKIRTEGLKKTFQTVNSRLNSPSPLGYSSAGVVVASGGLVEGIQPGDRVACGGADYANHAEYVAIPKNLAVKVPENVSDEEAAFTTVGSVAMQGVRLASPLLGETFLVLGLGLLGQITVQLLKANGCTVIGTDLDPALLEKAKQYGAIGVDNSGVADTCGLLTSGHGVDGVLVCAGSSSNQPIELCGNVTRSKGRVIVVGAVKMDIPREDYFKKEISVVISRSYGPGRYDPDYEDNGNDYPYDYVRFTEQRNMSAFLQLVSEKKIDMKSLITHRFSISNAPEAYKLIEGDKKEVYLGIILNYDAVSGGISGSGRIVTNAKPIDSEKIGVSFFGAGNYATASLLPPLTGLNNIDLRGLVTASGRTAQGVSSQFGFSFCASEFNELLQDDSDVIMIASRHDTHAKAVEDSLSACKHVFVEKPLALSVDELARIDSAYRTTGTNQLMVGFNRRFSPLTRAVADHFDQVSSPLVVNIRINSGSIPDNHWIQDPHVGGGRIIGEACHFIDLASALIRANPKSVYTAGTSKPNKSAKLNDNVIISLCYENGSIANIVYTADGSRAMPKEYIEVFGGARSAVVDDFRKVTLFSGDSVVEQKKLQTQNKGQSDMIAEWVEGLTRGIPCVEYECLLSTSLASILAVDSLSIGQVMPINFSVLETAQ